MNINDLRSNVETVAGIASALSNHDPREVMPGEDARAIGSLLQKAATALREHVDEYDQQLVNR